MRSTMPKRLCATLHFLLPFALPTRPHAPDGGAAFADAATYDAHAEDTSSSRTVSFASDAATVHDTGDLAVPGVGSPAHDARRAQADTAAALAGAERALRALLTARETPAFDTLLRRARLIDSDTGDDYQRSLPHERWLSRRYGLPPIHAAQDAPLAPFMMLADGLDPSAMAADPDRTIDEAGAMTSGGVVQWACLEPAHIEVTHDRLVLAHPQTLGIDATEATHLAEEIATSATARGLYFVAPSPTRWYLGERRGTLLAGLHGASPLRAAGRSIDIWLPVDETQADAEGVAPRSSRWMGFQTELQMAWHAHPVNTMREARGARAVNAVWLHGRGTWPPPAIPDAPFSITFADAAAARGLSIAAGRPARPLPANFAALCAGLRESGHVADTPNPDEARRTQGGAGDSPPQTILIQTDALSLPMIDEDWRSWLDAFAALDQSWFAPALQALREHVIDEIRLTPCGEQAAKTLSIRRGDLLAFWRRRTFAGLLS